jgi:S-adenosyl-L-methionine hydrolase (adenosine-forming)
MRRPIITLTTDFGLSDHFVGTMKGVILGICPQAEIIDISNEIPPFETHEAAFALAESYSFFPPKTVHVVVVDPGVGTSRRPILAEGGKQYFIAPDNGVLSMIYSREKVRVRAVTAEKYFLKDVSRTFHGRDVFAPVAAHLAGGVPPGRFGKLISDYLRSSFEKPVRAGKRVWTGTILKIDRFGNVITNFPIEEFARIRERPFELTIGPHRILYLAQNYAECGSGELFAIAGSSGNLEVSTNQGSAAKIIGCVTGAQVELTIY